MNKTLPAEYARPLKLQSASVLALETVLREALRLRVQNIPDPPSISGSTTKLAILFSGGLDCTVLARLAHELLPLENDIDLLNVVFENPRVAAAAQDKGTQSVYEACPDRMTGRSSLLELQNVCPGRKWRFVTIDVPYSESTEHRDRVISLMHPHDTEMDLSIAYALYFASRGRGYIAENLDNVPYTTPARVLLSGLGADELFGGYTRHATAYSRRGYPGLIDELELDVSRLGKRNLGRDDRVISHWGKETRFPYLDETFLQWALARPVWEKCGFGQQTDAEGPQLEDGKVVLRLLAWKLGMRNVAKEKKRAIQFGARTAKMQTGKSKGTSTLSRPV